MSTVTGKVVSVQPLGTSYYGNPYYMVTMDNGKEYRTQTDASLNYEIKNKELRQNVHTYMVTRAGRLAARITGWES